MTCECVHEPRLIRKKTAEYLGRTVSALEKRAKKGLAPKYHLENGNAYYYVADLEAFEKSEQIF